jgi:dihydrofolate reductase
MTRIVIIAAVAQNGVIGRSSSIPWRLSEDYARFKRLTMGYPCIMGSVTFESLPAASRPLPGRENIVLTHNIGYCPKGATVFHTFPAAIEYVRRRGVDKAFIAGGAAIYQLGLAIAERLELTRIHHDITGDRFFPPICWDEWELVTQEDRQAVDQISGDPLDFSYLTYQRRP